MPASVETTVTELPESRVRVEASVPADEVEKRLAVAAKQLGRGLRIPGFRAGKVPPPVVIQRVGREAVLDEAVRESISLWYTAAIDAAGVIPIGEPALDIGDLPGPKEPLTFSIEIGVRPAATLGDYKGLEVERKEPEVTDEQIGEEVDRVRERSAKLETADRPAARGDFVVMDYLGTLDGEPFAGGEGRDQMVELGSDRLVPGFEDQLQGASAGEERTIQIDFPDDYGAAELAGKPAEFTVTVKEIKVKELPEANDELAEEAGFDSMDELREDIRTRLTEAQKGQVENEFREAVLDAAVESATVEVPEALVEARAREMWDSMLHQLSHQGITPQMYAQISGRTEEDTIAESKPEAEIALKREAVLAAIATAEGIEPTDEAMVEAVQGAAPAGEQVKPKKLLERLRDSGRLDALKDDLRQRQALDLIVEAAKPTAAA